MPSVCLYFKIHQPERLRQFSVYDIATEADCAQLLERYFDDERNKFYLQRVAQKCYIPALELLRDLIEETKGRFKINLGITGIFIDQAARWQPEIIELLQQLAKTKAVEFTGETYYHSLVSLYSIDEFRDQVKEHKRLIRELFLFEPKVFANTELIYFDALSSAVAKLGFKAMITEGAPQLLDWRSPNFVYQTPDGLLRLLLRNFKLSDDISFRFSSRDWAGWPLTADKFASWLESHNSNGEVIGLFMDFETFGEHQWSETGIFEFLGNLPFEVLKRKDLDFALLSEAIGRYQVKGEFSSPYPVTWADTERDLTAWLHNQMQKEAALLLYSLEKKIKRNENYLKIWRKLQVADHFYYMCTKWFADGDVHKYFNPYDNPYEAYIIYRNILEDLHLRLK